MANEVTLLDFWASPFAMRVRIALALKSINYQHKEENLLLGEGKSPLLLKMNPIHKKVPVLIHNGKPVSESLIAVEYIDEVWPGKTPLLPNNHYERALARFWGDYVDKKVHDSGKRVCMSKGEDVDKAKQELIESLKVMEGELGENKFFGGESLGYVDVALVPWYKWFYAYEKCGCFSIESECPKIVAWGKRCVEVESVGKSLPDQHKLYDFLLVLKKHLGIE